MSRSKAPDQRNAELAMIHIAKKQLGLDDSAYRQILWAVGRVKSSSDLDQAGRSRLLEHFKKCGWAPAPPKSELAKTATGRKTLALWSKLKDQGKVKDGREGALLAFLKHTTGIDKPEWMTSSDWSKAIQALVQWEGR